jgi:hypothetical protein
VSCRHPGRQSGCDTCRHATDCSSDRACEALRVYVETGRCTLAARQPSREIAQAIDRAARRALTAAERRRNYEALKIKMLRDQPMR